MSTQTISPEQDSELVASVAAEQLGIKAVTLRKYSTMVEKQLNDENRFRPADNSHRLYTAADLKTFQAAIELAEQGTTLATALGRAFGAKVPTSKQPAATTTQSEKSAPATTTKLPLITTTTVDPSKMAPAAKPDGPTNAELYKQQEMIIRRLDSLSDRLNQVLDQLDQQASQAAKPWWHFWEK
ncbi:hypothetical protein ACX1CG_04190 [Lactiplantibacillus plantarum]